MMTIKCMFHLVFKKIQKKQRKKKEIFIRKEFNYIIKFLSAKNEKEKKREEDVYV